LNQYIDLKRVEFVITDTCSGHCKHCSRGERPEAAGGIDSEAAAAAVNKLAGRYKIESVMTFGGEPLLFADTVCRIHAAARNGGIPKRQIITNGFFSKDPCRIEEVAEALCLSGVNDVLLSVDAFHQEFISIEPVMRFAEALVKHKVPSLRAHPAWVINERHDNPYNTETKSILKQFADKGICATKGNDIFPSGNALKYLSEYFLLPKKIDLSVPCGSAPYTERLDAVACISINPNGEVYLCSLPIGNINNNSILDIVDNYNPYGSPESRAVLVGGVPELLRYAATQGVFVEIGDCRSACGVCRKVMTALNANA